MDIQEIGAWGELLGGVSGVIAAVGVIITLLYLARQVHQNTEQTRAQMAHNVMASLRDVSAPLTDAENAELYLKGLSGQKDLSEAEKFHFNAISDRYFRVFEEAYLHFEAGRLEDGYWQSISGQLKMVLEIPGIKESWQRAGDNFNQGFREWANSLEVD